MWRTVWPSSRSASAAYEPATPLLPMTATCMMHLDSRISGIRVLAHPHFPDKYYPRMRMNQGVEWAAHCAALLAVLPPDVAVPAATLAEFHDLPAAYLAKALQQLAAAGIVTAVPGRRGGYRLARSAEQITLLDI